jgi:hypothetical protein
VLTAWVMRWLRCASPPYASVEQALRGGADRLDDQADDQATQASAPR